jgi:hypothetical protein
MSQFLCLVSRAGRSCFFRKRPFLWWYSTIFVCHRLESSHFKSLPIWTSLLTDRCKTTYQSIKLHTRAPVCSFQPRSQSRDCELPMHNVSSVKTLLTTSSLMHFDKNIVCYFEKRSSLPQRGRCSFKFRTQSYDFRIYNYHAGVVVGRAFLH